MGNLPRTHKATTNTAFTLARRYRMKSPVQQDKCHILDRAAKEVRKVLTDNLYEKFVLTKEYKDIQEKLMAVEQIGKLSGSPRGHS